MILGSGYAEDYTTSNVKLVLGFAAYVSVCTHPPPTIPITSVGTALLAQFYPVKYPDNKILLIVCVSLYVIFTTVLNWYTTHAEGDAVLHTYPPRVRRTSSSSLTTHACTQSGSSRYGLKVCSRMPRFSYDYTITIGPLLPASKYAHVYYSSPLTYQTHRPLATMTAPVTEFFDVDGLLVEAKWSAKVERLLDEYESKKAG